MVEAFGPACNFIYTFISVDDWNLFDIYAVIPLPDIWHIHCIIVFYGSTCVRLQNLPWYKTGLVSRQVLHLLSKLQNWIWPKTGQYKTCLVQILRLKLRYGLLKANPDSHTLPRNIYSKWKGRFSADAKPVLVRQVARGHKAGFGAAGLGTAQSWFWSRHKAGFGAVGLGSAQSRFWSRHKARFEAIGLGSAQSRFWSRHKAGFGAVGLGSTQSRFWSRHKAGLGAVIFATKTS